MRTEERRVDDAVIDCSREIPYWADARPFPRTVEHPLFYSQAEIERARTRVARHDWAKQYRDDQIAKIEESGILSMGAEEIRGEIFEQVTFPLPRCPVDRGQRSWRENFWTWSVADRHHVHCETCSSSLPGAEHEPTGEIEVIGPAGGLVKYAFWEDEDGTRYFFNSFVQFYRQKWVIDLAPKLARSYVLTQDATFARKAAVIVARLAEVYPNYPVHGFGKGFGSADKQGYYKNSFYRDTPFPFVSSRWANFAVGPYVDAAYVYEIAQVYDLISDSGVFEALARECGRDVKAEIERDLLYEAARHTLEVDRRLTNYQGRFIMAMGLVGRLLGEQDFVAEAWEVYTALVDNSFHYDGFWCENTLNYFNMIVGSVLDVPHVMGGTGGIDVLGERPIVPRIYDCPLGLHSPQGETLPVNDTWSSTLRPGAPGLRSMAKFVEAADELTGANRIQVARPEFALFRRSSEASRAVDETELQALVPDNYLLPGVGDAVLGIGRTPNAVRTTLYFGPWAGHHHYDTLGMSLFGCGHELLSDIGYTWSLYRPWVNSAASHNTVVVDGREQSQASGRLLSYKPASPTQVGMISAEASAAFESSTVYTRTMLLVPTGSDSGYTVDLFEVEGGGTHDYLLHGSADFDQSIRTDLSLSETDEELTGIPDGAAYSYISNVRGGDPGDSCKITFEGEGTQVDVHILGAEGDRLLLGRGPSVRRAKDADHRLDEFSYPVVCWRKQGGKSRFLAVIENHQGEPVIERVQLVARGGSEVAVLVGEGDRTRVILVNSSGEGARVALPDGRSVELVGRAGVIHEGDGESVLEIIEGSRLALDGEAVDQVGGYEGCVLDVVGDISGQPGESRLVVDVDLPRDGSLNGKVMFVSRPKGPESAYMIQDVAEAEGRSAVNLEGIPRFVRGRSEIVSGERGRFESKVELPMKSTYRGCLVSVGGETGTIIGVEGRGTVVVDSEVDYSRNVGVAFEIFATSRGDQFRILV
ncbi:MAG: hypothetical protein CME25_16070 [Gemmatimonadetes bacterium]|nr:hypothetical protein [Gemmatimonadota bacterium]